MAGRQSKLTPEVQKRICDAVSAGNYYEAACAYGGISYQTFQNWMARGEKSTSGIYFDFFEAVLKAEADAEVTVVAQWRKQIPENWQAARDFLARRYPARWGPKDKLDLSGTVNVGLTLEQAVEADQELEQWQQAKRNQKPG